MMRSDEIPKHYEYTEHENRIYQAWLKADAFAAVPDDRDKPYVIMMPLPNVTGALHIGHAMDNVMQDLLIRWRRMMGDNSLWMPGTDHAGIATQALVEKRLYELEGKTRHDLGRDALVAKIWAWKDEYQQRIYSQLQGIGCSCDWQRARFTMDAVCTRAVREAFFRLFRDGMIYKGNRLVNWDCVLQTAVSDDEIVYEKVDSHFWHIRYPIIDPLPGEPRYVVVATTRPETMLGDTAVACHPDPEAALACQLDLIKEKMTSAPKKDLLQLADELKSLETRQRDLLPLLRQLTAMAKQGRKVLLPLVNREIPLVLDPWAKPELGTGCVKITPAHDPNDYDVWRRHQDELGIINILNPDGTLNDNAGPYATMDRFKAREKVVADLEALGLMEAIEDREIEIGHSDRSKSPIEPYLSKQWFVKMGDVPNGILCGKGTGREFRAPGLAQAAMDAIGRDYRSPSGRNFTFFPDHERYGGTYHNWLSEKRDWCISRQLWWGHQIPIWHGAYQVSEIENLLSRLPQYDPRDLWLWIAGGDGTLYDPSQSASLPDQEKFDVLICLRNESAQQTYSDALESLGLQRDPDVLDTWFSSALWPFSTLGWPDPETAEVEPGQRSLGSQAGKPNCLGYYYPGSCLVTGRDIITLWVARMHIMGLYLMGDVPFVHSFIHANIQDGKGERMSKSKGNGIDPVDIIADYGADALRYVLCSMQTGTQDIRLPVQAVSPFTGNLVDLATAKHGRTIFTYICPETGKEFDVLGTMPDMPVAKVKSDRFDIGRAFCTKLWNAARFALMNLGEHGFTPLELDMLADEDRWLLSRLSKLIGTVSADLRLYNPASAIGAVREFFWSELCDWYIEFVKPRFRNPEAAPVARSVLAFALDQVLRLLHPFVPFITEVLWELLGAQCPVRGLVEPLPSSRLLISASWPEPLPGFEDENIERSFDLIQNVIKAIRELRSHYTIPLGQKLNAVIKAEGEQVVVLARLTPLMLHIAKLESLRIGAEVTRPPASAMQVIGDMELYVTGLIDPDKERDLLQRQATKLTKEIERAEGKLRNESFTSKAPTEVVQAEQQKLAEYQTQLASVLRNLQDLGATD